MILESSPAGGVVADVYALIRRRDRCAWRGHGPDWLQHAERLAFTADDPAPLRLLASVVEDVRLLRPAIAAAVRLPPPIRQSAARARARWRSIAPPPPSDTEEEDANDRRAGLWRDVQHLLMGKTPSPGVTADVADVGALAYFVRMRRSPPAATIAALRRHCRPGLLRAAARDDAWEPAGVAPDQERTRTRTMLLALAVDAKADAIDTAAAARWLADRPGGHATRALVHHVNVIGTRSGRGNSPEPIARPRYDPFTSEALRLFPSSDSREGQ